MSWDVFLYQKSVQNHVFYDVFWLFRVSGTFASKSDLLKAFGSDLGGLGSLSGASWRLPGASWGLLGVSWGRLVGALVPSWRLLGASWGPPGGLLGPLLGPKKRLRGLLGPIFWAASFFALFQRAESPKTL